MRKGLVIAGTIIVMSAFNQMGGIVAFGSDLQTMAIGPGEKTTQVNITTYTQATVVGLGNWERQPDSGLWKFKLNTGGYLYNSWVESLTASGSFYYVNQDGVMLIKTVTPDGRVVNAEGLWIQTASINNPNSNSGVATVPSAPTNNNNNGNSYSDINTGKYKTQKELEDATLKAIMEDEGFQRDVESHPIDPVHNWVK